jgi:hypothetical protein
MWLPFYNAAIFSGQGILFLEKFTLFSENLCSDAFNDMIYSPLAVWVLNRTRPIQTANLREYGFFLFVKNILIRIWFSLFWSSAEISYYIYKYSIILSNSFSKFVYFLQGQLHMRPLLWLIFFCICGDYRFNFKQVRFFFFLLSIVLGIYSQNRIICR